MTRQPKRYHTWLHTNWPLPDRDRWAAGFFPGDGLTRPGPLAEFKPRTVENAELAWGRYLDFQKRAATLADVTRAGERLTERDLVAFGRELLKELKISSVLCIFTAMARAVRVMDPEADVRVLSRIIKRLARLAKPTREIDSRLISPPDLVNIAESMMDEADAVADVTYRTKLLYRDGLLILWEALCPLRRGTMQKIKLGEHLIVEGDGMRVELGEDMMKGNRAFGADLPKQLGPRLFRYIKHYRPHFLKDGETDPGYLFLSNLGVQMFPGTLSRIVKDNLQRQTGKNFSFHMFRHAAASFISEKAPHRLQDARKLLHHRQLATTWTYYVRKQQKEAIEGYQGAVKDLLKRERRQRAKARNRDRAKQDAPKRPDPRRPNKEVR